MTIWQSDGSGSAWQRTALTEAIDLEGARIVPFPEHQVMRAALVTTATHGMTVNGLAPLGVAVLDDRDEIAVGTRRLVFSRYAPPEITPCAPDRAGTPCGRCLAPVRAHEPCVSCPGCHTLAHESAERACFSYDPRTACCGRERSAFDWTPADQEANDDA